ncbi:hypothetical protein Bca52824_065100 [Brassica carinata]|uniref:Uncharacterized protein n=1 Tax=Brassica carinata TaxID=52824 RepID=A0A8X7QHS4_BRACI|nr:hypothetical protein Bca52824_065100 [Brassica carinata]
MALIMAEEARTQLVPCYFVFGDSVFDNGNNNDLNTTVKVHYSPYGIDFARGPTGRFSNGRNIPDFIAELMGFSDYIPPFAGASPQQKLEKCLYTINIGSNDYLNNYFMQGDKYNTSRTFTYDQYAEFLIGHFVYVQLLYVQGARKVGLFGVSKLGCTPMIASHGGGLGCAAEVNKAVESFNKNLKDLVSEFNTNFNDAKITYVDIFTRFTETQKNCCSVESGAELCAANKPVCEFRRRYVYWDKVHSTEAANMFVANSAFAGVTAFPYSLALLAEL